MHCMISCVHCYNRYKQVDPSRVFIITIRIKDHVYLCNYIFHLKYPWFCDEQFVYDLIINQVLLGHIRG